MTNEENFQAFLAWAEASGWSQGRMAEECISSRSHLNQVLQGHRGGRLTWKRLVAILPMEGLLLLEQCPSWNVFSSEALAKRVEKERLLTLGAKCREMEEVAS